MSKRVKKASKKARVHKTLKSAAKVAKSRIKRMKTSATAPATRLVETVAGPNTGAPIVHPKGFPARPADTRWPAEIIIGKRHRKDFGNLDELGQSISDRGGLIQRIAVTPTDNLIAGERRIKAWARSRFKDQPIPVHVMTPDSIIAGEWDENARRKDFTPEEAVTIKKEIERQLSKLAKERQRAGTKADPKSKGQSGDQAARAAGFGRRTIEKAEAIVEAAEKEPEKYDQLRQQMNKTGKVDAPFKKLKVMQQTEALRKAPPPLPMNGPYKTVLIDFPVPAEGEKDQETIDATARSFRGYPEMAITSCCAFAREKIEPILDADCSVWLTFPNFHIVNGFAHQITSAFTGFKPVTMLSWKKDKIGRGQVLRDQTEHAILITRGKPVFNVFGENPPTTWLEAPRRENSRKPDELYALIERVTPAPRYAEIFSRGGRSEQWDCHGDEVGKFAPEDARAAEAALMAEAKAGFVTPNEVRAAEAPAVDSLVQHELQALEAVARGDVVSDADMRALLQKNKLIKGRKPKLTAEGIARLARLKGELGKDEPKAVRRTLPGRDSELISFAEDCGHVVSRTIDHDAHEHVATCECGWSHRVAQIDVAKAAADARIAALRALDDAVTAHWKDARDASPITSAMLTEWRALTAVQAGVTLQPDTASLLETRAVIKRKRMGQGYVLTEEGERELHALDAAIQKARSTPHPDAHRVLHGEVFNEFPAPASVSVKPQRFQYRKEIDNEAVSRGLNGLPWKHVGQTTTFNNPYDQQEGEAPAELRVQLFRDMLNDRDSRRGKWIKENVAELRGFNLACVCEQGQPCHADVLLELANAEPAEYTQPTAEEPAAVPSEGGSNAAASAAPLAGKPEQEDEDLDIRKFAGGIFDRTARSAEAAE